MTTATNRAFELIVGLVLVGQCVYAMYTGRTWGNPLNPFDRYSRSEDPWVYWPILLITIGIGMAFLFGVEDNFLRWPFNFIGR
jgi:hypothetical protein